MTPAFPALKFPSDTRAVLISLYEKAQDSYKKAEKARAELDLTAAKKAEECFLDSVRRGDSSSKFEASKLQLEHSKSKLADSEKNLSIALENKDKSGEKLAAARLKQREVAARVEKNRAILANLEEIRKRKMAEKATEQQG